MIRKKTLIFTLLVFLQADLLFCQIEEYTLKAVYLERISRFLEWPPKSNSPWADNYFIIGVLGETQIGKTMEALYATRKIKNKQIKIHYFSTLEKIEECHILYIGPSKSKELNQILALTRNKPIVTVGDTEGYSEKGVLVNFFIENSKLRFEINERGFYESGILIDSLLLKVARVINPVKG
ncbi:MAG: YfiR family protein [Desulfobacteraceae bacterium]